MPVKLIDLPFISLVLVSLFGVSVNAEMKHRVQIAGGEFRPQYGASGSVTVKVKPLLMDQTPVTRRQYREFLISNPHWQKGRVLRIFAEPGYLQGWRQNRYPAGTANYPATSISYFAAAAYCNWVKGRLPTVYEWEYAARAANADEAEQILNELSQPHELGPVGRSLPNQYGVQDLHGMISEWTLDYNSSLITSGNRQDGDAMKSFFCGSASTGAADRLNYPAFIRYAMRGGLRPDYTISHLGFRCVYE